MEITARRLLSRFVASALDKCAKRDKLSGEQVEYLHHVLVSEALDSSPSMEKPAGVDKYLRKDGRIEFSRLVPTASGRLQILAHKLGEKEINERVVQEYIVGFHNQAVDEDRHSNSLDTVENCGVHEAKVIAKGDHYRVEITHASGEKEVRKVRDPFRSNPSINDSVIVHRDTLLGKKHEIMRRK